MRAQASLPSSPCLPQCRFLLPVQAVCQTVRREWHARHASLVQMSQVNVSSSARAGPPNQTNCRRQWEGSGAAAARSGVAAGRHRCPFLPGAVVVPCLAVPGMKVGGVGEAVGNARWRLEFKDVCVMGEVELNKERRTTTWPGSNAYRGLPSLCRFHDSA